MKFGAFWIMSRVDDADDHQLLTDGLDQFVEAERVGFDSAWIAEHHFFGYGAISAPGPFLTAVAARTSRIQLGYAVVVSALHHPILVAEEIATLDHLSNGRVFAGVGSGMSPVEMQVLGGIKPGEARGRHFEFIQVVNAALQNETFSYEGESFSYQNIRMLPRPYRKPFPLVQIATINKDGLEWAGRTGTPVMFGRLTLARLLENRRYFADAALAAGQDERWIREVIFESPYLMHLYLAEDDATARSGVVGPTEWYVERSRSVIGYAAQNVQGFHPVRPVDEILDNYSICGSPATAVSAVERLAGLGIGNLVLNVSWGGMPHTDTLRSLRLFSESVFPRFKGEQELPSLELLLQR